MAASGYTKTVIEEQPTGLRVVMPVPRAGCAVLFLSVWLMGWFAGEVSALKALFVGGAFRSLSAIFLLFWLIGWTAGGMMFGSLFLLMLDGREILSIEGDVLRRRVEFFRWGLSWCYPLDRVTNLRPAADESGVKSFISFDYAGSKGDKSVRVGTGLTESVVHEITARIWTVHPALMPR